MKLEPNLLEKQQKLTVNIGNINGDVNIFLPARKESSRKETIILITAIVSFFAELLGFLNLALTLYLSAH